MLSVFYPHSANSGLARLMSKRTIFCPEKSFSSVILPSELNRAFRFDAPQGSGRADELPNEYSHVGLGELTPGDGEYRLGKVIFGSI